MGVSPKRLFPETHMFGWIVAASVAACATAVWLWARAVRIEKQPALRAGCVLVVIDMQERFLRRLQYRYRVIDAVAREIEAAKTRGDAIILVEYHGQGATIEDLHKLVDGYARTTTVNKRQDGGSREVLAVAHGNLFPSATFRLCGLNADACVLLTALGLRWRSPLSRVEVVKDACDSAHPQMWLEYWFPWAWRIRLVRSKR
jgi:hypothetical protein